MAPRPIPDIALYSLQPYVVQVKGEIAIGAHMRRKRLIVGVVLIAAAVVIFQLAYPSVTIRYRLTLEANVDGKSASGSSVNEVTYRAIPRFFGSTAVVTSEVQGEAVALDLGQRGTLFALLKAGEDSRSSPDYIVLRAFNFPGGALPDPVGKGIAAVRKLSGKTELPPKSLPLLVRFRDIGDPKTVEKIDPLNLEATFGAGVKLTRATLEIVPTGFWPLNWIGINGEPLTNSLTKKLVWLNKLMAGGYLKTAGEESASNILYGVDFKTPRDPWSSL